MARPSIAETGKSKSTKFWIQIALKLVLAVGLLALTVRNSRNVDRMNPGFLEKQWMKLHEWCDGDGFFLGFYGTLIVVNATFWGVGALYTFLDLTGKPEFLTKYKIQPDKNRPLELGLLWKIVKQALSNHVFVGVPFSYLLYYVFKWRGVEVSVELPTSFQVLRDLAVFVFFQEIAFYYSHRMLHHPRIYKHIHKRHHQLTAPVSIAALYAHPVEHIFSNLIPPSIGPIVMGSHLTTVWFWAVIGFIATLNDHSGYHFPLMPSPEFHDYHHLKYNVNYGVIGALDWLHKTDDQFRKSTAFKRHRTLFGLVPLRVSFPDENTKRVSSKSN